MEMVQGKCPLCGGELEYGDQSTDADSISNAWECVECGATGLEVPSITFDCHSCVCDANGNDVEFPDP